ncbi:MAG: HAD family hydrolase, partial [Methylococcales bacterium]
VGHLIATEPELRAGSFTGKVAGTPCFRDGKVARVEAWLAGIGRPLEGFAASWFYSDSHNDLPLLKRVDHPVAVDPDETLREVALNHNWPIISLRDQKAV